MLKAVIFDMDGVIIDSEPMHARANLLALQSYQVILPEHYCNRFIGSTTYYMYQTLIKEFHINASPEELLNEFNRMNDMILAKEGYTPIPDVIDLIQNLNQNGVRLAIASSSPLETIEDVLDSLHIREYFQTYVSGMQVPNPKPAPDIFLKAAEQLEVDPCECIVIEDSMNGVNAAYLAGIPSIGFINPNSGNQDLTKSAILVEGFDEVDYNFIHKVYQRANQLPVTIAITDRLIIRELSTEDFDRFYQMNQTPEIMSYISDFSEDYASEREKFLAYLKNSYPFYDYGIWGVYLKDTNELIGRCGIEAKTNDGNFSIELGYIIDPAYHRRGYGYESAMAVIDYSFSNLGIDRLYAVVASMNSASIGLIQKLGFYKDTLFTRGNQLMIRYYLEKDTFLGSVQK
ncbi:MAG: HAD-superfamily hydrolase, subfamily variant 3 [Herbinix sp.]|nr:HAD-superfamily hydrolase, subfamily variant 3 [Herbinix sp.]